MRKKKILPCALDLGVPYFGVTADPLHNLPQPQYPPPSHAGINLRVLGPAAVGDIKYAIVIIEMKWVHLIRQRLSGKRHPLYFYLLLTTTLGDACCYCFLLKNGSPEARGGRADSLIYMWTKSGPRYCRSRALQSGTMSSTEMSAHERL